MTTAIAAMCMRSPAPTEPSRGTIGCTPAFSMAMSSRTASSVRPGPPRAAPLTRASMAARTSSRVERGADAARVRLDHLALVALQHVERHAVVAHVAEAGVEPVDQPLAVDGAVDDGAAREDRLLGVGRELDGRELAATRTTSAAVIPAAPTTDGVGHEAPACATSSIPSSRSGSR